MKRLVFMLMFVAVMACKPEYPAVIHVDGGRLHVQGIALDQKSQLMYCSFTSAFFKTDLNGNIIGSITGINGHLGAMTFDAKGRKVYASLEIKDDYFPSISDTYKNQQNDYYFLSIFDN